MVGDKTHEQQLRIFEKQENTAGADKNFDARADLKKSSIERERQSGDLAPREDIQTDNRSILRGANQQSQHHKNSGS